jgi:hypothetical protein
VPVVDSQGQQVGGPANLTCTTDRTVVFKGFATCCRTPKLHTPQPASREGPKRSFGDLPRCLGRIAGGGRSGAAAHPRSRNLNAVAAVSPTDPAPPRSVPTSLARRTVGPPITTGHTPSVRAEDPTARGKIPRAWVLTTIRSTARAPLLSRSGDWAMTAIADQTRDELDQMLGIIASNGMTQCGPTRLVDAQIHLRTRTN